MQAPKIPDNLFWQARKKKKTSLEYFPEISPDFLPEFYIGKI